jgi:hypothetical protein
VLHGSQQGLLGDVEEVQALDAWIGAHAGLTQSLQITFAGARVVQAGQERQITLVTGQPSPGCPATRPSSRPSSAVPYRWGCAEPHVCPHTPETNGRNR